MGICVNLTHFSVNNDILSARFEGLGITHTIDRVLEPHEVNRHQQDRTLSFYFLVQSALYSFEATYQRIDSLLVLCPIVDSKLHFVLFVKNWKVGPSICDTPLTRIDILRVHQLPNRPGFTKG